jgi:transcriptional regulator with XRE-family HTH domain
MPRSGWWEYVVRVAGKNATQKDIAQATGLDPASVSRWKTGTARADLAVQFARAYHRPPVESLIAAGYL